MICPCWDYTTSRRTSECPGRPCLLAVCLHRHPIKWMAIFKKTCDERLQKKQIGKSNTFPHCPCTGAVHILSGNPNKQHNKQKCVISQEAGWNPIYPLFKRFFQNFKYIFTTFRQSNIIIENQIHSLFWSLMSKEPYIKNSCIDLLNTQWKNIFLCESSNVMRTTCKTVRAHIPGNTDRFMTASLFSKDESLFRFQCQPHNALVVLRQNDLSSCKEVDSKMHAYWGEGW